MEIESVSSDDQTIEMNNFSDYSENDYPEFEDDMTEYDDCTNSHFREVENDGHCFEGFYKSYVSPSDYQDKYTLQYVGIYSKVGVLENKNIQNIRSFEYEDKNNFLSGKMNLRDRKFLMLNCETTFFEYEDLDWCKRRCNGKFEKVTSYRIKKIIDFADVREIYRLYNSFTNEQINSILLMDASRSSINFVTKDSPMTIFDYACQLGNIFIVMILIRIGINHANSILDRPVFCKNNKNIDMGAPLARAAHHGHLNIVKLLIKYGFDVNKSNAIEHSAAYGHLDIVKLLTINDDDIARWNSIERAAINGHFSVLIYLMNHLTISQNYYIREEKNVINRNRLNRLLFLARKHLEIIEYLVEYWHADVNFVPTQDIGFYIMPKTNLLSHVTNFEVAGQKIYDHKQIQQQYYIVEYLLNNGAIVTRSIVIDVMRQCSNLKLIKLIMSKLTECFDDILCCVIYMYNDLVNASECTEVFKIISFFIDEGYPIDKFIIEKVIKLNHPHLINFFNKTVKDQKRNDLCNLFQI